MSTRGRGRPASDRARAKGGSARGASRSATRGAKGPPSRRAAVPGRRLAIGLAVSVLLVGFLLVGVFPTRAWLAQRDELGRKEAELQAIRAEQDDLDARVEVLETPDEVERMAREEFGMTRPGEKAYRILPAPESAVDLPDGWPFTGAEDWLNR